MPTKLLMGNQAIALGAIHAGVNLVCGYPGTPSTEILETVAANRPDDVYIEWSINEKAALEVGAGAAYCGARVLVTMKQVGLNVASDPLMSLAYVGVKGGMVIVVADDPGPISSQTEQDTRHFAQYAKLPVFDPSTPARAYAMMEEAFALSQRHGIPVIMRPTTRVCHACQDVDIKEERIVNIPSGFEKDTKWVIFPRLSYQSHIKLNRLEREIGDEFSRSPFNTVEGEGDKGVIASGISAEHTKEILAEVGEKVRFMQLSTPHPFPSGLTLDFLKGLKSVLIIEELDPVVENAVINLCAKNGLSIEISGKGTGHLPEAGENGYEGVKKAIFSYLGLALDEPATDNDGPELPVRPPVLCAGCPHRGAFYAVKQAMKGKKAVFTGDIGCYTLGNASPLNMVDTCLCMGAGITIAQGMQHCQSDVKHFAFIGDSTFFHTGIAGVVNAVYNNSDITIIILDNSTTAMTGHQPHPGTGKTMMGETGGTLDIESVLRGCGVSKIITADPLNLKWAMAATREACDHRGVSAVIFRSPCIALIKPGPIPDISDKCTKCMRCINEIGCPALSMGDKSAVIDKSLCYGCGLCAQICPFGAISGGEKA